MKFLGNIFSAIYLFFEAIDDGRPGNKGTSVIGAIFVLAMLITSNLLSFFPTSALKDMKWLYYFFVLSVCSILIMYFYRKNRYLRIVAQFNEVRNKQAYYLIAIAYVIFSLVVFVKTR